jgi:hypothetical protein
MRLRDGESDGDGTFAVPGGPTGEGRGEIVARGYRGPPLERVVVVVANGAPWAELARRGWRVVGREGGWLVCERPWPGGCQ